MAYYIHASVYEVKTNLSQFIRALERGAADCIVVQRYGVCVAQIKDFSQKRKPPLAPQTDADLRMWRRAIFLEDGGRHTRRGQDPVIGA